jgi:3-oxoacyl-[acyl-carrier-protein] synthase-3
VNIKKISISFPPNRLTNDELEKLFPNWNRKRFESKVGIHSRHVSHKIGVAELAAKAVNSLILEKPIGKGDFLIFCSQSSEYKFPGPGHQLSRLLNIDSGTGIIDLNLGCSGYVYSLMIGSSLIKSKVAKRVFLVTSEKYTEQIAENDVNNRAMFGDAASATILDEESDIEDNFIYGSDGAGFFNLYCGTKKDENNKKESDYLSMNGPEVLNFTMSKIPSVYEDLLRINGFRKKDIDYVIFHQANDFVVKSLATLCGLQEGQYHCNVKNKGNTVSNSIPIAIHEAIENKTINKGSKVVLIGFGVGYSWAGSIITIT